MSNEEFQKEMLRHHWFFDLDDVSFVGLFYKGVPLRVKYDELLELGDKHKIRPTVLIGG